MDHAVRCALDMVDQMQVINERLRDLIGTPLHVGIGVHYEPVGPFEVLALTGGQGQPGGHGMIVGTVDRGGLHRDGRLGLEYNTDTLRLSAYRFRFRNGQLELGARIEGQAHFAGLLLDYYLDGRRREERGFRASYAAAQSYAKLNLPGHHHPELRIGVRQWCFS